MVSCDTGTFGFINSFSKTDNFKVREEVIVEIDTSFHIAGTTTGLNGIGIVWVDTNGGSNQKYSYTDPAIELDHQAHVEEPEAGTHYIELYNQPGCTITYVSVNGKDLKAQGPQTIAVKIPGNITSTYSFFIGVACQ